MKKLILTVLGVIVGIFAIPALFLFALGLGGTIIAFIAQPKVMGTLLGIFAVISIPGIIVGLIAKH